MFIKRPLCLIKAILHFLVSLEWKPHNYKYVSHVCTLNKEVIQDMHEGCIHLECHGCLFHRKQALRCECCGKLRYYKED